MRLLARNSERVMQRDYCPQRQPLGLVKPAGRGNKASLARFQDHRAVIPLLNRRYITYPLFKRTGPVCSTEIEKGGSLSLSVVVFVAVGALAMTGLGPVKCQRLHTQITKSIIISQVIPLPTAATIEDIGSFS